MAKREQDFLTPRDAANVIGKSVYWLKRARRGEKGTGPPYYKIGGRFLYARADVLEWLEAQFRH
jgi:Helix-turn-helix domain